MDNVIIPWNGWRLVKYIGKGSYGTVYEIERTVGMNTEKAAMKVIPIPPNQQMVKEYRSEGYTDEAISSFCESMLNDTVKEYTMMRSMKENVNIVSCDDIAYLENEDSVGWKVYIRMELLTPFFSLSKDRFDEKEIIKLGKDICNALAICEAKNVVHRDIKPGNIFISEKGDYKLGDFGVARTLDHTTNATRVGTDKFMAPEVIKKKKYGNNVDLYSLGLVLFWLLNERRIPFLTPGKDRTPEEEKEADYKRLAGETLPAPKHGNQRLKALVLKACSYDRKDRFQSAQEMMLALEAAELCVGNDIVAPRKRERIINDQTQGHSWGFTTNSGTFAATSQQTGTAGVSPTEATNHTKHQEETADKDSNPKLASGFGDKTNNHRKVFIGIGAALLVVAIAIVGVFLGMNAIRNSDSSADDENSTVSHSNAGWLLNDSEEETVTEEDKNSDDSDDSGKNSNSNNTTSESGIKLPGFLGNFTSNQKDSDSESKAKTTKKTTKKTTNKTTKSTTKNNTTVKKTTNSTTSKTTKANVVEPYFSDIRFDHSRDSYEVMRFKINNPSKQYLSRIGFDIRPQGGAWDSRKLFNGNDPEYLSSLTVLSCSITCSYYFNADYHIDYDQTYEIRAYFDCNGKRQYTSVYTIMIKSKTTE